MAEYYTAILFATLGTPPHITYHKRKRMLHDLLPQYARRKGSFWTALGVRHGFALNDCRNRDECEVLF